jgi:hypothetical protein
MAATPGAPTELTKERRCFEAHALDYWYFLYG